MGGSAFVRPPRGGSVRGSPRGGEHPAHPFGPRGEDPVLADVGVDEAGGTCVEGGVPNRHTLGTSADLRPQPRTVHTRGPAHLVSIPLLDGDPCAIGATGVDRRGGERDVERHAQVPGDDGVTEGPDLVRDVAVSRDAVRAGDDGGDLAAAGEERKSVVGNEVVRDAFPAEFPGGQAGALASGPRLVDEDVEPFALPCRRVDRGERGAPVHERQPAGVAVRRDPGAIRKQRLAVQPDSFAGVGVLVGKALCFGERGVPRVLGSRPPASGKRRIPNPLDAIKEVLRGRPCGGDPPTAEFELPIEVPIAGFARGEGRRKSTGRPDGSGTPHEHGPNRVERTLEVADPDEPQLERQDDLIDEDEVAVDPVDGSKVGVADSHEAREGRGVGRRRHGLLPAAPSRNMARMRANPPSARFGAPIVGGRLVVFVLLGSCAAVTDRALFSAFEVVADDDTNVDDDSAPDDDSAGDDDTAPPCDVSWLTDDGTVTTWSADVQPFLEKRCAPCHTDNEFGGMSIAGPDGYDHVVGAPNTLGWENLPRVAPSEPERSYLLHKIVGCPADDSVWGYFQTPMPPSLPGIEPLTQDELRMIYRWISQGAVQG